ncbi:tyrosine-type recombinase/integrase, partial [Streptomyces sp. NPDC087850]|uniref:tyrosine-type recombinase/integrase n=1 Tax=Streptomyces sp. NPDC087850 TaxID=3365809 RepID=UPI00382EC4E5
PQLHRPAATGSAVKVSHLHSNHCASRRTHDLRHTHASWLIAGKVPLPVIQARLGHESITTTVDRYGHLLESSDDEVVAAVKWAMSAAIPETMAKAA